MCMVLLQQFGYLRFSSVLYLRIYFVSYPFLLLYDFGSAILRACGNSRYPFLALTLSGIVNVFLNIIFVVFFKLGVSGVAAATVLSTMLSALLLICRLKKDTSSFPFALHKCDLYSGSVSAILKVGIPSAIQGAVFCFANIFVQASVNSFGSSAIAGSTIAMNFEYFTYYVITAFGQTATTFTSQNYGVRKPKRMDRVLVDCMILSFVVSFAMGCGAYFFGPQLLKIYTEDPKVIQCGMEILAYTTVTYFLCGQMDLFPGALRGMGRSGVPMILSIIGTVGLRIVWIFGIFPVHRSLKVLFISYPASWIITIIMQVTCFWFVRRKVHRQLLGENAE